MFRVGSIPQSWSDLTWQQLCCVWQAKMRYGGHPDVAQVAALLNLLGLEPLQEREATDPVTSEAVYTLRDGEGRLWTVTARELSQMSQTLTWFKFPYGDPGKEAVKDEKGKIVEEAVAPVRGYVNPNWMDAMALPEETVEVDGINFQLPTLVCNNLTWQQYRSLQAIVPQLLTEGITDDEAIDCQAQFLAHILVPSRQPAAEGGSPADPFAKKHNFAYDPERAEQAVVFWKEKITGEKSVCYPFFPICFQVYQTAMHYYEQVFPLLFNGGKGDKLQDALTGEVGTINAVMKYQGYTKPEDVYAENLPIILSTLNTMAEEAKQIEQANARTKNKR